MPEGLYVSIITPDEARVGEWIASLWQGPRSAGLNVRQWLYLPGTPRRMMMVWDGDEEARAFFDQKFGAFCTVDTQAVEDATVGMQCAVAGDLDGFALWMEARGDARETIDSWVELRRRGKEAASEADASAAGRDWASSQS